MNDRDDVLFATTPSPHTVVLASAGTGKTHTLTSRYIELIARGAEPRTILATTFTRKAAGEIRERILSRLSAAVESADERALLNRENGLKLDAAACKELTARIARQVHRLNIGTLDSFFAGVLRGFELDLSVPPGLDHAEDEQDEQLRSLAVVRAIESSGLERRELALLVRMLMSGKLKRGVHDAILSAVGAAYNAFLAARADPAVWQVFGAGATAPTDADLADLVRIMRALVPPNTSEGTPNVNFAKNLASAANAIQSADWSAFLKLSLVDKVLNGEDKFSRVPIDAATREVIQRAIRAAGSALLAQLFRRNRATGDFMQRFDKAYREIKVERGVMRFDDVPRAILDAGAQGRSEDLYFRLDGRIDHILLDEFQDTSLEQFEILRPMLEELLATGDSSRTVLCVGDVKQSLYSWRGAEPELLPALKLRWPQFREEKLSTNRRSSQTILDAVNRVFQNLATNPVVQQFDSARKFAHAFDPHIAHKKDLPGQVVLTIPPDSADDDDIPLAQFVAQRVKALREQSPAASIAILTRTNKPIPGFILALREIGIPAVGERGNALTDSAACAAAISALHLADRPSDSAALFHVATSPLGEVLGVKWSDDPSRNELEGRWIASRLRMKLERDGIRSVLEKWQRRLAPKMDDAAYARFDQLVDLAGTFEEAAGAERGRPDEFVRLVRARPVEPPGRASGAGTVRVMTIHTAKGLEFDAVLLPELNKKWDVKVDSVLVDRRNEHDHRDPLSPVRAITMYPAQELQAADPNLAELFNHTQDRIVGEELSSLYVAMTRARLYLEFILPPPPKNSSGPTAQKVIIASLDPSGYRSEKHWHQDLKAQAPQAASELTVKWAASSSLPAGRLAKRSPSGLEGDSRIHLSELWRPEAPAGAPGAKERGTAFHAMFEEIEWLDDAPPSRDRLAQVLAALAIDTRTADAWINDFTTQLNGDLAQALRRDRYSGRGTLEVRREWKFAMRERLGESEYILNGAIDRLILGSNGGKVQWAQVLDYKSDDVRSESEIAERIAHYTPQLQAYKRAVSSMFEIPTEQVTACLLFTGPGKVVGV